MKQAMPLAAIAQLMRVNKSKLGYYFHLGLLIPVSEFPDLKLFLFDLGDVKKRLRQIQSLREKGYKLSEMRDKFV